VLIRNLISKCNDNKDYKNLYHKLFSIEKEKNAANEVFKTGNYDEAIEAYTSLLEFDPDNKSFNSIILANRALCNIFLNFKVIKKLVN